MKLNCGTTFEKRHRDELERLEARLKKLKQWHDVFAFLPVRVGENECRWLETVQRRVPPWYSNIKFDNPIYERMPELRITEWEYRAK